MRYFTFELIAAANDWVGQSEEDQRRADARLSAAAEDYRRDLEKLESRLSRPAWHFFRHGFGRAGLHDATLLSLRVGDDLSYAPDAPPPRRRRQAAARVELLNYEGDLHYTFDLRGLKRMSGDLRVESGAVGKELGDLYAYELTEGEAGGLEFGLLFASGATVTLGFERLSFRRRRVKS